MTKWSSPQKCMFDLNIQKSIADVHHVKENKGEKTHDCINQCRKAYNGIQQLYISANDEKGERF